MSHPARPFLSAFALVALLSGCAVTDYGSATLHSETENALSENRLSYNRLSYNRLSYNRLSYNRLSYNRLSYNSLDNDMHETEEGRELLRYIARCALAEGDVLVIDDEYEMPGLLGLATEWEDGPLDPFSQRRVSGCVIAHVNAFGIKVPISLRYPYFMKASDDEKVEFNRYEGAFFGNLFSEDETPIYSCYAGEKPDNSQSLAVDRGDRLLRVCADGDCGPVKSLGACEDICGWKYDGNHVLCKVPGGDWSDFYSNPVHVWLADPGSEKSVWPDYVEMLENYYGVDEDDGSAAPSAPATTSTGKKKKKKKKKK